MENVIERVRRGAELLDRERPGWADEVPADERLEMEDCSKCVLGHLFGEFGRGLDALPVWDVEDLGFNIVNTRTDDDGDKEYAALADAWRAEIRRRTTPEASAR